MSVLSTNSPYFSYSYDSSNHSRYLDGSFQNQTSHYDIFTECAQLSDDDWWKSFFLKMAKGEFQDGFSFDGNYLFYATRETKEKLHISEQPDIAAGDIVRFVKRLTGLQSVSEKRKQQEDNRLHKIEFNDETIINSIFHPKRLTRRDMSFTPIYEFVKTRYRLEGVYDRLKEFTPSYGFFKTTDGDIEAQIIMDVQRIQNLIALKHIGVSDVTMKDQSIVTIKKIHFHQNGFRVTQIPISKRKNNKGATVVNFKHLTTSVPMKAKKKIKNVQSMPTSTSSTVKGSSYI